MTDIATFEDRYGEERVIHKTRHGLKVKQNASTPALKMNRAISAMIGERIRAKRKECGYTLVELSIRCGMHSGHPKERMWAIENATRKEGMRLGTLYAIALALDVEASELLPSVHEVAQAAELSSVEMAALTA